MQMRPALAAELANRFGAEADPEVLCAPLIFEQVPAKQIKYAHSAGFASGPELRQVVCYRTLHKFALTTLHMVEKGGGFQGFYDFVRHTRKSSFAKGCLSHAIPLRAFAAAVARVPCVAWLKMLAPHCVVTIRHLLALTTKVADARYREFVEQL